MVRLDSAAPGKWARMLVPLRPHVTVSLSHTLCLSLARASALSLCLARALSLSSHQESDHARQEVGPVQDLRSCVVDVLCSIKLSSNSSNSTEPVLPRACYVVNQRRSPPRVESPFTPCQVLLDHTGMRTPRQHGASMVCKHGKTILVLTLEGSRPI